MAAVLGIWAHPDDEVFTSGGVMAEAVRRGDRVVCLHVTRGEAGLHFRRPHPAKELASVRTKELRASLERLGVTEQLFLDMPDGGLALVPWGEMVVRIHDAIAEVDPDTILTFGPDGYTGHPDHKALSAWVSAATKLWDKPRARVLHATVPREWRESVIPRLNEFDFFYPGGPKLSTRSDIAYRLDDDIIAVKIEALREHASQMEHLFESYGEGFLRDALSVETFRLGPRPGFRRRVDRELRCA